MHSSLYNYLGKHLICESTLYTLDMIDSKGAYSGYVLNDNCYKPAVIINLHYHNYLLFWSFSLSWFLF